MSVVNVVAQAHDEDVLEQDWSIANDINPDALDGLFRGGHLDMALTF